MLQAFINKVQHCSCSGGVTFLFMRGLCFPRQLVSGSSKGLKVNIIIKWFLISIRQTPQLLDVSWYFYLL